MLDVPPTRTEETALEWRAPTRPRLPVSRQPDEPSFLFIGPDKTGSTWICDMLAQHPQVFVSPAKDIYFFDRYYGRGLAWYRRHFAQAGQARAVGEFSHDYIFSQDACTRIARDLPSVRLISFLRNPVDRAFSEYLFIRKHGLLSAQQDLRAASAAFPSILEGGRYGQHLGMYVRQFGREALFLRDFEDIANAPADLLRDLCAFLDVDPGFAFQNMTERVLPASQARFGAVAKLAKLAAMGLRDAGFDHLVGRIKRLPVVHRALYRRYEAQDKPRLSDADRQWLREIYRDDVAELEQLLGRSFQHWLP